MQESTKYTGAEFSSKESGTSASICKISTSHDSVKSADGPESSSASAPESSVSPLHSLEVLFSDESSLCEPQPITSSSVLETAALLSGISHISSQGGIQIALISDNEVSVYEEKSQITFTLLQEDLYVFDTDDIGQVTGVVLESNVCFDECQPEVGYLLYEGCNNGTAYRPISGKHVADESSSSSDSKRDSQLNSDDSSSESENSSDESNDDTSESDDNSADSDDVSDDSSDSDDNLTESDDESDACSGSDDNSADSDEEVANYDATPPVKRRPLLKASDILRPNISFSITTVDVPKVGSLNKCNISRNRKSSGDSHVHNSKRKRPMLPGKPCSSTGVSRHRERRASTPFDEERYKHVLKKRKMLPVKPCPSTGASRHRKRRASTPFDEERYKHVLKKRKMLPAKPCPSTDVSRHRKRRASTPFDEERYKHVLKKRKLSPDRQFTYDSCPGTCPCKTRGRTAMIPAIERKYKVIQPLYERLLKSRTMESTNVSTYQCCDQHCRFRWLRKRIPNYDLLKDYWPLDLDVHTFSWGRWKDGEGHVC